MYCFPVAAVTNPYQLDGFTTTEIYALTALKARIQNGHHWVNIKVSAGPRFLQRL